MIALSPAAGRAQNAREEVDALIKDYLATHPDEVGQIVKGYLVRHPEAVGEILAEVLKHRPSKTSANNGARPGPNRSPIAALRSPAMQRHCSRRRIR